MSRAKICGITRLEDAELAVSLGAWAIGFIFHPESPRYIEPREAGAIIRLLPKDTLSVGVFVNSSHRDIEKVRKATGIKALQFHGNEPPDYCKNWNIPVIKAFRPQVPSDIEPIGRYSNLTAYLIDAAAGPRVWGGTGQLSNWELAIDAKEFGKVILSGGLTPENVQEAIRTVHPYAVDVSSGLEVSPGVKDPQKMNDFFRALRGVDE